MENQDVDARTTSQVISDWRGRMRFERQSSMGERLVNYLLLPTLWVLAVVAAVVAISW
jgi:hypothetical protein